jgi:hypothetical protein
MSHDKIPQSFPAPCIIDTGLVVNKEDIRRLLSSLHRVHYIHSLDGQVNHEGEGCILEIFCDPKQSTLIANHALYINVQSFDYLQLTQRANGESCFNLIQDNRQLCLIPLNNPLHERDAHQSLDVDALEAMVTQVLSAKWDVQIDDDDCPF